MRSPFRPKDDGAQLSHDQIMTGLGEQELGGFDDDFELPPVPEPQNMPPARGRAFDSLDQLPPEPPAQPAPRERRHFSRSSEMPSEHPAPPAPSVVMPSQTAEITSVEDGGSLFGQLKAKVSSISTGREQDEDGVEYYTPPEGFIPSRVRYKRHNHRPLPLWVTSVLLGAGLLLAIYILLNIAFFGMMIGRTNFVDDRSHASVRLTLDESAAMQAQLSEEAANDITPSTAVVRTDKNIQLILLVGATSAIGDGSAGECDSIVLVAVDHLHKKIKMVSVARELYAQIPDYQNNMIGEAYFYDSANGNRTLDVLREVIENNLRVSVDNIVIIDYDALQTIVNKIGGMTLTVTDEEALYMSTDPKYGHFPRFIAGGIYTMSGPELLNYLRMVNVGDGTDAERVVRLRNVLTQMGAAVGGMSSVDRAAAIYSVLPYVTTDMSHYQVYKLVSRARRCCRYDFYGYSLPVNGSWDYDKVEINGKMQKVVVADYGFNADYLQKFIYDDDLTYAYGNSVMGVEVPYISEEAKAAAQAETVME